jgi:AcrR family transcriptional regulator
MSAQDPLAAASGPDSDLDPRVARTKELVLRVALELLLEEGRDAVTPTRVAEKASVGRATIYRHWPDPTRLLLEAVAQGPLDQDFAGTGDLPRDLRRYLASLRIALTRTPVSPIMTTLLERAEHDEELRRLKQRVDRHRINQLKGLLRAAIDRGELPSDHDLDYAVAQLTGPLFFRRYFDTAPITTAFVRRTLEDYLALSGYQAPSPSR